MEVILEKRERDRHLKPSLDSQIIWFLIGCVIAMMLISICSPITSQEGNTYDLLQPKQSIKENV